MRLRKIIAGPERYDATSSRAKRRNPTVPLYPNLLAAQIVPFKPLEQAAAFPSLPINFRKNQDGTDADSGINHQPIENATPLNPEPINCCSQNVQSTIVIPNKEQEDHKESIKALDGVGTESSHKNVCFSCHKELRTAWISLPLSIQYHIYNTLVERHKYADIVAAMLKLEHDEFEQIKYQVNLRKIHQVSSQDVWSFGVGKSDLGPGVMDPNILETLMNSLVFASRYEFATEDEIERGRKFLWWLRLDDKIMDSLVLPASEQTPEPMATIDTSENQTRAVLGQRSDSSSHLLDIDITQANQALPNDSTRVSIPPGTTSINHASGHNRIEGVHNNKQDIANAVDFPLESALTSQIEVQPTAKGLQLQIDDRGHASVTCKSNVKQRPTKAGTSRVIPHIHPAKPVGMIIHEKHDQTLLARYFMDDAFPTAVRIKLLKTNPHKMSNLEHWLVYGTSWKFGSHLSAYGLTPQPADTKFDPRCHLLDASSLNHKGLRVLVDFQNEWVKCHRWGKKTVEELTHTFNSQAIMRLQNPDRNFPISTRAKSNTNEKSSPLSGPQCKPNVNIKPRSKPALPKESKRKRDASAEPRRKRKVKALDQDVSNSTKVQTASSNEMYKIPLWNDSGGAGVHHVKPAFPLLMRQHTPDNRAIQQHTGDTTIAILPSTIHPNQQLMYFTEPVPFQPRINDATLQQVAEAPELSNVQNTISAPATTPAASNIVPSSPAPPEPPVVKAPSYSPISDQDQESLPTWARQDVPPRAQLSPSSPTPQRSSIQLPFERPLASSIHGNKFQQRILDSAAESVPDFPYVLNTATTPSRQPTILDILEDGSPMNKHQMNFLKQFENSAFSQTRKPSRTAASRSGSVVTQQLDYDVHHRSSKEFNLDAQIAVETNQGQLDAPTVPVHFPVATTVTVNTLVRQPSLEVSQKPNIQIESMPSPSEVVDTEPILLQSLPFTPLAPVFSMKSIPRGSSKSASTPNTRKKPGPKPRAKSQPKTDKAANKSLPAMLAMKSPVTSLPQQTPQAIKPAPKSRTVAPNSAVSTQPTVSVTKAKKTATQAKAATTTPSKLSQVLESESTKKRRRDYGTKRGHYKKRESVAADSTILTSDLNDGVSKTAPKKSTKASSKKVNK